MSHTLLSMFFRVVYPILFIDIPFLQSYVFPIFIRSITTPPNHNYFFRVVSQRFRAANQPYPNPPPIAYRPSKLHSVMKVFNFLIVYLCSPNTGTCIYFLTIHISPSFFGGINVNTQPLKHTQFFGLDYPKTNLCLSPVIINFNISFSASLLLASVTNPSPYTLSRWRETHENIRCTY